VDLESRVKIRSTSWAPASEMSNKRTHLTLNARSYSCVSYPTTESGGVSPTPHLI
jgi:hypothetical protein